MAEQSQNSSGQAQRVRRIRSDPIFFVLIGVISATYILLICAMLLADAVYVATGDMSKFVRLDFSADGKGKAIEAGTQVKSQFSAYGLKITSGDSRPVVTFDSNRPAEGYQRLGSPNEDYGGKGVGKGGLRGKSGTNALPLGKVLVLAGSTGKPDDADAAGTIEFSWKDPVYVQDVQLLDVAAAGGSVVALDERGKEIASFAIENLGRNSYQEIRVEKDDVARLAVNLPNGAAVAELAFTWPGHIRADWERDSPLLARLVYNPITEALGQEEIRYSIKLSLVSCTVTAILSLWFAVPIGYVLSRYRFFGRNLVDAILDVPIVLPPLVVGLSLLILFKFLPQAWREAVVYEIPAVILAQFAVACAFAVRTMRATFDQIDARREQVALTLGCSRAQAFGMVVLPESMRGVLTAGTLAWARALGEFGPLLIFAGATRMKTEVLSTSVFLEMNVGNVGAAVSVSLIMVVAAVIVLIIARMWGSRSLTI